MPFPGLLGLGFVLLGFFISFTNLCSWPSSWQHFITQRQLPWPLKGRLQTELPQRWQELLRLPGCADAWVRGYVGAGVCGCMGALVHECIGVGVQGAWAGIPPGAQRLSACWQARASHKLPPAVSKPCITEKFQCKCGKIFCMGSVWAAATLCLLWKWG